MYWIRIFSVMVYISQSYLIEIMPKCVRGHTYITHSKDRNQQCTQCTACPIGYKIKTRCTLNTDTICKQCKHGSFNDGINKRHCRPCRNCHNGTYISLSCSPTTNTVCKRCPDGTFADKLNSDRCKPCTRCSINNDVIMRCSKRHDSVCGSCSKDYFLDPSTNRCMPCSYCDRRSVHILVEECFQKIGHSQYLCMPSGLQPNETDILPVYKLIGKTSKPVYAKEVAYTDMVGQNRDEIIKISVVSVSLFVGCGVIMLTVFIILRSPLSSSGGLALLKKMKPVNITNGSSKQTVL